jgi:hypothetical protein
LGHHHCHYYSEELQKIPPSVCTVLALVLLYFWKVTSTINFQFSGKYFVLYRTC